MTPHKANICKGGMSKVYTNWIKDDFVQDLLGEFRLLSIEDPELTLSSTWVSATAKHLDLTRFKDGMSEARLRLKAPKFSGVLWSRYFKPGERVDLPGIKSFVRQILKDSTRTLDLFDEDFEINTKSLAKHLTKIPIGDHLLLWHSKDVPLLCNSGTYGTIVHPLDDVSGKSFLETLTNMIVDLNFYGQQALDSLVGEEF